MSLKKRMFYSNLLILTGALAALAMVATLVIGIFEDSVEKQLPSKQWILSSLVHNMPMLLLAGFLIIFLAIAVLLLLSAWFTNRMNRRIMEPLDELVKASEHVRAGNLSEEIHYHGETELENVCEAFNAMQRTIPCRSGRTGKKVMPEISMDVEQVRCILDNLLENSMKYAGIIPVKIGIKVYEESGSVVLEWKDNSAGVPPEKLDRIFDRFYRCDESRNKKGSGVGLYVVKYIMKRHHGSVCAANEGGLKISLYFPREEQK